ncbi:MAG: DNA recombination protein RmuC [Dokdonella sp.]|nr:DNA recombination protein RmuC [Dokdonella sp.]MCB1569574.1 DNA recombination protein RmuC [Xanthomonadales bacterium]MCB1572361.1 DNA recombination protein RmuC [Xanthomonadales bacterium]MCB1576255.1 DNA recombination protein RmuC [Xanthomonadales bacterium]
MTESSLLNLATAVGAGLLIGGLALAWLARRREAIECARKLAEQGRQHAVLETALQEAQRTAATHLTEATQLRRQLDTLQNRQEMEQRSLLALTAEHAALKAGAREQAESAAEKLRLLEQAEQRLRESFQNLANQILEAKAERFREQNAEHLGGLLDPLKVQLKEFREAVTQTHANEQRERGMLVQEIRSLKDLNQRISQDAVNLTRALKGDSRAQGAWGEMVLERVLEASGLQAGREYETQGSFEGADGTRQRPDVIVHLPESKDVIIDAKVSLVAWERSVSLDDEGERQAALRDHLVSLRRHIDGLAGRNYSDIPGVRTLDFVLLFVPVEAAFIEAVRADGGLYGYALERKISLVSPSTLLATLRTVAYLWRIDSRNNNALEIARRAANLHDNFVLLVNELEVLGSQLHKAQGAHANVVRRLTEGGKGSVILQVKSLADMGAPAKKTLPRDLVEAAGAETDEAGETSGTAASDEEAHD